MSLHGYMIMLLQSKICVKNKAFQAVWMRYSILVASDSIRCHQMSHNSMFYRWICRCNFAKSEPRNGRKDAPTDHSTPQASRSNPTTGGFSVQTNRASCVSVRQKLFCPTETAPSGEGRKHLLQSRNFGRKEVQIPISNGWSIYGSIAGFEYEKDYEYKIKVSETNYLNYSMDDPAWIERDLFEVISKDKKDSEDLSLHLIPETYYKNILFP